MRRCRGGAQCRAAGLASWCVLPCAPTASFGAAHAAAPLPASPTTPQMPRGVTVFLNRRIVVTQHAACRLRVTIEDVPKQNPQVDACSRAVCCAGRPPAACWGLQPADCAAVLAPAAAAGAAQVHDLRPHAAPRRVHQVTGGGRKPQLLACSRHTPFVEAPQLACNGTESARLWRAALITDVRCPASAGSGVGAG